MSLLCLLVLFKISLSWFPSDLSYLLASELPANLSDFNVASSDSERLLVINGGTDGVNLFNRTFVIDIANNASQEITTVFRPSARINACSYLWQNFFYLYGGSNATDYIAELWRLNITSEQWQLLNSSLEQVHRCSLYLSEQKTLMMVGQTLNNTVKIRQIDLNTITITSVTINFTRWAIVNVVTWDGTISNITMDIQQSPSNVISYITSNQLPMELNQWFFLSTSSESTIKYLYIDRNIYKLIHNSSSNVMNVTFLRRRKTLLRASTAKAINFNNWTFFASACTNTGQFFVELINEGNMFTQRVTKASKNFYSQGWPDFSNTGSKFSWLVVSNSNTNSFQILLMLHKTYLTYILPEDIYSAQYGLIKPSGLVSSFFGLNQCTQGWRLPSCDTPSCPNSVILNSVQGMRALQIQCSGHGSCVNGTCQCDDLWGGNDCSVYQRKKCQGQVLDNFPMINCQCMNSTLGGNDCTVIFCPNGCTGHGVCMEGVCTCDKKYYGADCSIMIIGFPS